MWIFPHYSIHFNPAAVLTTCCDFTGEEIAIVQDALTGSIALTPLTVYSGEENTSTCAHNQSATTEGYLSDAILLASHSAHVYLTNKAQTLGQNISETTIDGEDFEQFRPYLLKQSVDGCTGPIQFNSYCNRVNNIVFVRNFVRTNTADTPWEIESRAFVMTSPENYSLEFRYPNGTPSTTNILVFYDGTQNVPPDRIYRYYYRGNFYIAACL